MVLWGWEELGDRHGVLTAEGSEASLGGDNKGCGHMGKSTEIHYCVFLLG